MPGQQTRHGYPPWLGEAKRLYAEGHSSVEVGRQVGAAGSTVITWLRRAGVEIRRQGCQGGSGRAPEFRNGYSAEAPDWLPRARKLYTIQGRTLDQIAAEVGVSYGTVASWLRRSGVTIRRPGSLNAYPHPVVHLVIADPEDPGYGGYGSEIFTRCCGYNYTVLIASGLVTSRRELVTCPGRTA